MAAAEIADLTQPLRVLYLKKYFLLSGEGRVSKELKVAILGFLLLLPAVVLVSTSLLGFEPPNLIVQPPFVMGGVLVAAVLNVLQVLRVHLGHEAGGLVSTMSLRLRGTAFNLIALALAGLLFATIAAYLFLETYRVR